MLCCNLELLMREYVDVVGDDTMGILSEEARV